MVAVAAAAPSARADDGMSAHFGGLSYRLLCVGCHGADGRGNAAVSRALKLRNTDLTIIARRNGGVFPDEEVAIAITGLGDTGHARVRMTPWAEMFADEFDAFASRMVVDELVARRIDHLVAYLESLQVD
jgi:hypothetical protein